MDVSIIVINYKTFSLVENLISSIKEKTHDIEYEIILVDNSESDDEFKKLMTLRNNNVQVIKSPCNLGFGKANNLGSSFASGKYLFFLNSDTLLINNAIYELFKVIDGNQEVGIVGANLYTSDLKPNGSFAKEIKDLKYEKKTNSVFNIIKRRFNKRSDFNNSNKSMNIDGYVCGAALMISKELFDKIGGFDKDIFMYAEESLLCWNVIHRFNKLILNVPASKIIHLEGKSFKNWDLWHINVYIDGNYIYYLKAFGKEEAIKYLDLMIKIYKKKAFISSICFSKNKKISHINFVNSLIEKKEKVLKEN